jgi:hypothetical protein
VVDEKDDTPLAAASVYFNNTTIATSTNEKGEFQFETVRMLNTELVIYCPGYEILVYKPNAQQVEGKRMVFKLRYKELVSVNKPVLSAEIRRSFLAVFSQVFLGNTEEASKCKIMNESVIYFGGGKTKTSFKAYADSPLVIINNMLGYKIIFNLEDLWYDDATGQNNFFGYARYEELAADKKWIRNRKDCYNGSSMHFFRSLVKHQLYEQGFGTFRREIVDRKLPAKITIGDTSITDIDSTVVEPMTAGDILYIDSTNELSIRVKGQLIVQYYKNPTAKAFLTRYGAPLAGDLDKGVESIILLKAPQVGINYAGVLDDAESVIYSGYWLYEKLGNRLPYNYVSD